MKKTINLSEQDVKAVEDYKERMKLKNFSEAIRSMIQFCSEHVAPKEPEG